MRVDSDMRERLREIADELAGLAAATRVPDERDYAEALLAEVKRIERNTNARADLRRPHC
jgi:hypothetical protein